MKRKRSLFGFFYLSCRRGGQKQSFECFYKKRGSSLLNIGHSVFAGLDLHHEFLRTETTDRAARKALDGVI